MFILNNKRKWKGPGKVLGQDGQQVLVKYGSHYVRVHPCRLALEKLQDNSNTNTNTVNIHHNSTQIQQNNTVGENHQTEPQQESDDEEYIVRNIESTTVNENKDVDDLSATLERMSMSTEVIPHCPNEYNKFKNLKKNSKVQFKYNDEEEYKSATLLSRSGKVTGKYNNAWNVRLNDADETVKSIDFESDVSSLTLIPPEVASQTNTEEVLYSQVFLTELENQTSKAKLLELES